MKTADTDLSSEFSVTEITPGAGHNSGYDSIITITSYIQEGELLALYEKKRRKSERWAMSKILGT